MRELSEIHLSDIDLNAIEAGDFVLFRTGQIERYAYGDPAYFENHPQLSHDLIDALLARHIRFIGIDCAGIRQHAEHEPADRFCEQHGVYIIENLTNLSQISAPRFDIYTMWLGDPNMTGLRCRVIADCEA